MLEVRRCLVRVLTYRSFDLFRETKDTLPDIEKEKAFYSAYVSTYVQLPSHTIDVYASTIGERHDGTTASAR